MISINSRDSIKEAQFRKIINFYDGTIQKPNCYSNILSKQEPKNINFNYNRNQLDQGLHLSNGCILMNFGELEICYKGEYFEQLFTCTNTQ